MDDREIIELYMKRSEKAISETSDKYGKYCHYIAYSILHNDEDSEECVNDTFLRTWNSIPPNFPERLQTYLGKITRNLAINKWEKTNADKRGSGVTAEVFDELAELISDGSSEGPNSDSMVIKDTIDRFLEKLPTKKRKIFVRRYWYMSTVKEIADEYGLTESSVSVTLFRLREKLKKDLEGEGITI